jgi:hypothetical protein
MEVIKMSDTIICDHCDNYNVSMDGCIDKCDALQGVSPVFIDMDRCYVKERMNSGKDTCKWFK